LKDTVTVPSDCQHHQSAIVGQLSASDTSQHGEASADFIDSENHSNLVHTSRGHQPLTEDPFHHTLAATDHAHPQNCGHTLSQNNISSSQNKFSPALESTDEWTHVHYRPRSPNNRGGKVGRRRNFNNDNVKGGNFSNNFKAGNFNANCKADFSRQGGARDLRKQQSGFRQKEVTRNRNSVVRKMQKIAMKLPSPWQCETLMTLKVELNTLKDQLSDKEMLVWHQHTSATNPAGIRIFSSFSSIIGWFVSCFLFVVSGGSPCFHH
jgi:hypothetical protein